MLKKLSIFLFFISMTPFGFSQQLILLDKDSNVSFYVDASSVTKQGKLRRVWAVQELSTRDEYGVISHRILKEFDCKDAKGRVLQIEAFTTRMARGVPLVTLSGADVDSNWTFIPPATFDELYLNFACKK
jgi:hypothetical protein